MELLARAFAIWPNEFNVSHVVAISPNFFAAAFWHPLRELPEKIRLLTANGGSDFSLAEIPSIFLLTRFNYVLTLRPLAERYRFAPITFTLTEKPHMKKKSASRSAFFNPRVLISFAFCAIGAMLALFAFALYPGATALARQNQPQPDPQALAQDSITMPDGTLTEQLPSEPAISNAPTVESGAIEKAAGGQIDGGACSQINGGLNPCGRRRGCSRARQCRAPAARSARRSRWPPPRD